MDGISDTWHKKYLYEYEYIYIGLTTISIYYLISTLHGILFALNFNIEVAPSISYKLFHNSQMVSLFHPICCKPSMPDN